MLYLLYSCFFVQKYVFVYLLVCQLIGCGAIPHFLTMLSVLLSGNFWFAGVLLAGLLSSNIANALAFYKPESEVIWMLLNCGPITAVSLVLIAEKE